MQGQVNRTRVHVMPTSVQDTFPTGPIWQRSIGAQRTSSDPDKPYPEQPLLRPRGLPVCGAQGLRSVRDSNRAFRSRHAAPVPLISTTSLRLYYLEFTELLCMYARVFRG